MTHGFLVQDWFDGDVFRSDPATLRVRDGLIVSIEARWADEPGLVDARGDFVMPGLINTHVHVARAGFFEAGEPPLKLKQIVGNLQGALRAGVTTLADMGCTIPMLRSLRSVTAADPTAAPRILGAGPMLTAPEGYPFNWLSGLWRHSGAALPIDGAETARRAVARTLDAGMDHIKIAIMHESFSRSPLPALGIDAALGAVAEARASGRRVFAHAHGLDDYRIALDAGVTGLMHSCFEPLGRDDVQRILDAGTFVCPTLWAYDSTCQVGDCGLHLRADLQRHATGSLQRSWQRFADAYAASGEVFPESSIVAGVSKESAREAMRVSAANLRLLADAGVPIAFGNDASFGVALLARPYDELASMAAAGLDHATCLRSATGTAADLLGRRDLGRLAVGCAADLVVAPHSLQTDLSMLDVDRTDVELRVFARGNEVPTDGDRRGAARIAGAYIEGTGRTLGRTLLNACRAALAG